MYVLTDTENVVTLIHVIHNWRTQVIHIGYAGYLKPLACTACTQFQIIEITNKDDNYWIVEQWSRCYSRKFVLYFDHDSDVPCVPELPPIVFWQQFQVITSRTIKNNVLSMFYLDFRFFILSLSNFLQTWPGEKILF